MGPIALNGVSSAMSENDDRIRVVDVGWQKWQPWKTAAIATHLVGGLALLWGNKGRVAGQYGAMTNTLVKTGFFAAALGADLSAAELGRRISQQQLSIVQWVVPALVGLNIAVAAKMGERQRPTKVVSGLVKRLDPR